MSAMAKDLKFTVVERDHKIGGQLALAFQVFGGNLFILFILYF